MNSCGVPIFGVNNILWCKVGSIYPTFALNLERMRFGTLDDLAVNIKFDQTINLIDSGRDNLLVSSFTCDMINAGNRISDLNSLDSLFAERMQCRNKKIIPYSALFVKKNSALGGIPKNSFKCGEKVLSSLRNFVKGYFFTMYRQLYSNPWCKQHR